MLVKTFTFNTKYGLFVLMHSIQVTKLTFLNVRALVFHSMVMSLMPILQYLLEEARHTNANAKMILPLPKYQEE